VGTRKTDTNFDLFEPEGQYRGVSDNAPFTCFTANAADGSILNCNKATRRLVRYSKNVLLQMKVFELYADTPHGLPKAQKFSKIFKPVKPSATSNFRLKNVMGISSV
jgi:hypothetical protein